MEKEITLNGSIYDIVFINLLFEKFNERETKRFINIIRDLIKEGHKNLYLDVTIAPYEKYMYVKDCDLPSGEWFSFSPCQLGMFWIAGKKNWPYFYYREEE